MLPQGGLTMIDGMPCLDKVVEINIIVNDQLDNGNINAVGGSA